MDKIMDFEELTKVFQKRYDAISESSIDARQTKSYKENLKTSNRIISTLQSVVHDCLNLTKGLIPKVHPENQDTARLVCPFPQLLNVSSIKQVQLPVRKYLNNAIDQTFLLGLTSHLILSTHPARSQISQIDKTLLFRQWAESAAVSDIQLKSYNRDCNDIPDGFFLAQYVAQIQPIVKDKLGIGFWKEGKFKSRFQNIYYSGCMLGMMSDMAASKIL